jgi:hypothetical protein
MARFLELTLLALLLATAVVAQRPDGHQNQNQWILDDPVVDNGPVDDDPNWDPTWTYVV